MGHSCRRRSVSSLAWRLHSRFSGFASEEGSPDIRSPTSTRSIESRVALEKIVGEDRFVEKDRQTQLQQRGLKSRMNGCSVRPTREDKKKDPFAKAANLPMGGMIRVSSRGPASNATFELRVGSDLKSGADARLGEWGLGGAVGTWDPDSMNDMQEPSGIVEADDSQQLKGISRVPVESAPTATPAHFSLPWTLEAPENREGNRAAKVIEKKTSVTNRKDIPETLSTSNQFQMQPGENVQLRRSNKFPNPAGNAANISAGDSLVSSSVRNSANHNVLDGEDGLELANENGAFTDSTRPYSFQFRKKTVCKLNFSQEHRSQSHKLGESKSDQRAIYRLRLYQAPMPPISLNPF